MNTQPVDINELRAARRAALPSVLSSDQLRRRATANLRHAVASFVEDNAPEVQRMFDLLAVTDGPKAWLDIYIKLLEFTVPKLSRAEVSIDDSEKGKGVAHLTIPELQALIKTEMRTVDSTAEEVTK